MSLYDISLKAAVFLVCALFCGGLYFLALVLFKVPSSKTTRAIRQIGPRNRPTPDGISQLYNNAAEIAGRIGTETTHRLDRLNESSGLTPTVTWSTSGRIQIGRSFTVTVSADVDISFFIFQGHTLTISSTAEGTSEVYWKS